MSVTAAAKENCTRCAAMIEVCAFCNEPGCGAAICYGCLNVALGQTLAHPHGHGG